MACVRTHACRGCSLAQLARPPVGGPRAQCAMLRAAPTSLLAVRYAPGMRASAAPGSAQKAGALRRGASKKRRGLAPKKSHPPSWLLQVAQVHRKRMLSSVVATSTLYARTRVRLRLRSQLFKKIVKNEKVRSQQSLLKSQQSVGKR